MTDRIFDRTIKMTEDIIAHPDKYPDDFVVIPLEPGLLSQILSRERIRLLSLLREHGPFKSVGALAKALGRSESRVSRDLMMFEGSGLVVVEREGKSKTVRATELPILLL